MLFFGDTTSDKPYRDSSGRPLVGAVLTFFLSGTTQPAPVYGEDGFEILDPIVSDENGVVRDVYLDLGHTYRVVMKDAFGRLVFDVDPYLTDSALFLSPVYHAILDDRTVPGASLAFFDFDGITPKDTFADGGERVPHKNPVISNAGGVFPPIYLSAANGPGEVYEVVPSFDPESPFYSPPVTTIIAAVASQGDEGIGRIAITADGDVWVNPTTAPNGSWNDVAYGLEANVFCAVGEAMTIMRSTDGGNNWEAVDISGIGETGALSSIIWIPGVGSGVGRFVIGSEPARGGAPPLWIYSDDAGETWAESSHDLGSTFNTYQFAYHDGILLAGGRNGSSLGIDKIARSLDGGASWDDLEDLPGEFDVFGIVYWEVLEAFVCVTNENMYQSVNGVTWSILAAGITSQHRLYNLSRFQVLARMQNNVAPVGLYTSPDGQNWTRQLNVQIGGVAQALIEDRAFASNSDINVFYWSDDAESWVQASSQPIANWSALAGGLILSAGIPTPTPATPEISSLDPSSAIEGSGAFTLTVHGSNFLPPSHQAPSVVRWNGQDRETTFISDEELQAAILAGDVAAEGSASVTVRNGDVSESAPATFTVNTETTYVVFLASGTFDVPVGVTEVDVLLVAGGGGGGSRQGGGGGAGGVRIETGVSVTPEAQIAVTIGGGGAGGAADEGVNGDNSSFGDIEAVGGGGGGGRNGTAGGASGGSGGGGANNGAGGAGTAGQGNDGGASAPFSGSNMGGGGGGAGEAGESGTGSSSTVGDAGDGGDGVTLASLGWGDAVAEGAPLAIGGGGGGGAGPDANSNGVGGLGGGGDGGFGTGQAPENGTANTGGGGGGSGGSGAVPGTGGNGGSGLVIVRYSNA